MATTVPEPVEANREVRALALKKRKKDSKVGWPRRDRVDREREGALARIVTGAKSQRVVARIGGRGIEALEVRCR